MCQQVLAGGGESLDTPPARSAAFNQAGTGQFLEFGQGLRNRGLAQRQALRGARKMALLGNGHQATEMPQLHSAEENL
jgi:hypothetical protein